MDKPNILFLFTDQHRLSALGCYDSNSPCQTPNIDKLAAEGIRFENTYTVCPVCSPARGSIMTGLYPHSHGICSNVHNIGCSIHELEDRPELLSRKLESAGYSLGYSGKWHLGSDWTSTFGQSNQPAYPKDVGFEGQNFPGHGAGGFHYQEYKEYLAENGWRHKIKGVEEGEFALYGELEGPVESTVPYFLAENTISLIDRFRQREQPFFIWHNNWGPHAPYYATKEYLEKYRDVEIPEWLNYRWPSRAIPGAHWNKISPDHERVTWDHWAEMIRHYYAFTTMIDDQIGRIVKHLEDTGLAENTIIVFSADHGETLGSHGGLTDKGYHHFEETHRIPLIVRFPDGRRAGVTIDSFASNGDIYPTILDMAGVDYETEAVHGRSLLPLIEGNATDWRDYVVTEFHGVNSIPLTQRTLRKGNLKYGYNCCGPDELYDLEKDPWETVNRIDHPDYRQAGRTLRAALREWMQKTNDPAVRIFRHNKIAYYDGGEK